MKNTYPKQSPGTSVKSYIVTMIISVSVISSLHLHAFESPVARTVTPAQSLLPMLGGLLGILMLILVLALLFKKFSRFNFSDGQIKIIETQNLGTKEKLVVVDIQNRQFVLGVTPHMINSICELEQPITRNKKTLSFDSMMKKFLQPNLAGNKFSSTGEIE